MGQLIANVIVSAALSLIFALAFYPGYLTTRFFNLSQAVLPAISAYAVLAATGTWHMPLLVGIVVGVGMTMCAAFVVETCVFAPLRRNGIGRWQLLVASLGVYAVVVNLIAIAFGDEARGLGLMPENNEVFGASLSIVRLATIGVAIAAVAGMGVLLHGTQFGRSVRAVGSNPALCEIIGIKPFSVALKATLLGGLYAGLGGAMVSLDTDLTPGMGFSLLINGVVVMILAGLGSIRGMVMAAILLATTQHLVSFWVDSIWMDTLTYSILTGFLIWKPYGVSGRVLRKVEV